MTDVIAKLAATIAKLEANKHLDQYGPPSYGDVLHDGLVGSGKTVGSALGGAVGLWGGRAAGGLGSATGMAALGALGHLTGGWAGHIAYLQGPLMKEILSHPENWTVDAAGAIVPVMPPPSAPPDVNGEGGPQSRMPQQGLPGFAPAVERDWDQPNTIEMRALPGPFLTPTDAPGGLPGLLAQLALVDPRDPAVPAPGGLLGLVQDSLRANSVRE